MWFGKPVESNGKDLFVFMKAKQVHLHDKFLEKTILRFIPKIVTPNQLTILRILLSPVVFWFIIHGNYRFGVFLFLLAAITDALDGAMARTRNQITRFGMLFDPLADKLLIGGAIILLVFKYFPPWIGISTLGIEILFILSALFVKIRFKTVRMANLWGKIKMFLQVFAVFFTLLWLLFEDPMLFSVASGLFGLALGFAILSLFTQGV